MIAINVRVFHVYAILTTALSLLPVSYVQAHAVHYDVLQRGISAKISYTASDPVNYAEYELFGPGDTLPHQTGRTDKNGFVCFFPNRTGIWVIKVRGESTHGLHGATIEVKVDDALNLKSFNKPFVETLSATLIKLFVGISLIIGMFGAYLILKTKKTQRFLANKNRNGEKE
ncbi:MAG: hypothetical protein HQL06_12835 [Nitrospirae bacterium]|nr:hypothetical protein [Nitrospirota bacterium]